MLASQARPPTGCSKERRASRPKQVGCLAPNRIAGHGKDIAASDSRLGYLRQLRSRDTHTRAPKSSITSPAERTQCQLCLCHLRKLKAAAKKKKNLVGEHRPNIRSAVAKNRRAAYPLQYEEDGPGALLAFGGLGHSAGVRLAGAGAGRLPLRTGGQDRLESAMGCFAGDDLRAGAQAP